MKKQPAIGIAQADVLDAERAYLVYASGEHRPTVIARETGIQAKRIHELLPSFRERWVQDTEAFRKLSQPYIESRAAGLIDAAMTRLDDIITNGDDRAAIQAIRTAIDIVGARQGTGPQIIVNSVAVGLAQGGITHIDDVRRLLRADVNGHVEAIETKSQHR